MKKKLLLFLSVMLVVIKLFSQIDTTLTQEEIEARENINNKGGIYEYARQILDADKLVKSYQIRRLSNEQRLEDSISSCSLWYG